MFLKMITPIMVFTGTILNLLTIMVFCRQRMRKYCISLSMICLAISDTGVLSIPVLFTWLDETFFNFFYINNTIWCHLHLYLDLVFCASSSWIIIFISTERWFAVYKPFKKSRIFTNVRVAWTLLIIFLMGIFVFLRLPLTMHLVVIENSNENKTECDIKSKNVYHILGILSIILIYVLPSIILAILNIMIIIRLRIRPATRAFQFNKTLSTRKRKNRKDQLPECHVSEEACNMRERSKSISNQHSKNDRNLSITLVTVAIVFMILTFPFQGYWFYENFYHQFVGKNISDAKSSASMPKNETSSTNLPSTFQAITLTIKNMNYVINFFMYSALSTLFREEFFAIFTQFSFSRTPKSPQIKDVSTDRKKYKAISEFMFPIHQFVKDSDSKKILKIRIETYSILAYLQLKQKRRENDRMSLDEDVLGLNERLELRSNFNGPASTRTMKKNRIC